MARSHALKIKKGSTDMKPNYTTDTPFAPLVEHKHQNNIILEHNRAVAAEARRSAMLLAEQKKRKRNSILAEGALASLFSTALGICAQVAGAFGLINNIVSIILGTALLLVAGFAAGSAYERSMNV